VTRHGKDIVLRRRGGGILGGGKSPGKHIVFYRGGGYHIYQERSLFRGKGRGGLKDIRQAPFGGPRVNSAIFWFYKGVGLKKKLWTNQKKDTDLIGKEPCNQSEVFPSKAQLARKGRIWVTRERKRPLRR